MFRNNANLISRRHLWSAKYSQGPSSQVGTGTLTLVNPVAYRGFQPNAFDNGSIAVNGTYTGQQGAVEASWAGGAWNIIDPSPSGGNFSGLLNGQSGGQGTLSVRWVGNPGSVVTQTLIGVGDIFIIGGQSNAVGMTSGNQSYSHATLKPFMLGNDYNWKELTDPVDRNTNQIDTVSSDICGGSCYPYIATQYMASRGIPCGFVPCAKGGSQISDWAVPTNHQDRTTLYGSMVYRTLQTGAKCVLWWQGESDVIFGTTQASYNSQLDAIANAFYADTGIKLMVCKLEDMSNAGVWAGNEAAVNAAITEAWGDNGNILQGPDLSTWTPNGDIHYTSDEASSVVGPAWWTAIRTAFGWSA